MHLRRSQIYRRRWHLAVTFLIVILPFAFLLVFSRVGHIATGALFGDVLVSAWRLVVAYAIAVVLGWLGAMLCARGRVATVALPVFDVLQSIPLFAALPIAALAWGPTSMTVITFLILAIIWPILFSVTSALKLAKRDWDEAAQIAGLRGWRYVRLYLWPVTVPGLVTGSIVGVGEGWEALVATEMIVRTRTGLGTFFQAYSHDATITAFGMLGFLLLIFSTNKLIWIPLLGWSHRQLSE